MKYQDKAAEPPQHRRDFFQVAATVGSGLTLGAARLSAAESRQRDSVSKKDDLRVGVVGIGVVTFSAPKSRHPGLPRDPSASLG